MIDVKRYNSFSEYIQELISELNPEEFKAVLSDKLFELYKHVSGEDVLREVGKIVDPQVKKYFEEVRKDYDKIVKVVNELYGDISKDVSRDLSRIKAIERVNSANVGTYTKSQTKRIAKIFREGLEQKLSAKQMQKSLSKIGGRVATYSEALANTQVMSYGRTCKHEKAIVGGIKWFEYVGAKTDNTRTFCLECLAQAYFTFSEIEKLNNGAGQPKPVATYAGGYRCKHQFEPDPFRK